ncbi:ATP-dependent DNA helicase, putative [Plasmodium gallinaceum]|uniref:DNA 3'-5' helicase n=1 Tax=Plasmodium gallinaceum TaxID=5849 RepID=A0A1J1GU84_PLAGA|nr:ATP-dependent DNA helicase, putative [Plasmodium gallinaceum]CRG95803.1 ATP-dependent DNA helicase, putative [Plasmodium gallinaceum]
MMKYITTKKTVSSSDTEKSDNDSNINYTLDELRIKMEIAQKKHFGYKNLKDFQVEAVHATFHKKDSFIVMATGMGKSLCYQIPSLMDESKKKFTIVISPLISLMKDQVDNLNRKKISSVFLGSGQKMNSEKILTEIKHGLYNIVYCSPEYALNNKNLFTLLKKRILLIAIDEVHCMSEWGHDFRPSYRKLNELRSILKEIPIMCLTATCTKNVQSDILKNLNFDLNNCLIKRSSVNKKNLYYSVKTKTNLYDDLKYILDIPVKKSLERTKKFIDNSKICPYNSTLIYVNSKKECESIHDFLKDKGLLVSMYHADLSNEEKKDAHEKFLKDEIQIIVATVAFGMGIDKPDIRRIIHYGFARSLEAYVQQVGRAGRDNSNAEAILFFNINDESKTKNIILRENTANNLIETNFERVKHIITMFTDASDYAYSTACRRKKIYEYFDEKPIKTLDIDIFDQKNNLGVCYYVEKYDIYLCARCDNCMHYLSEIKKKKKEIDKIFSNTNNIRISNDILKGKDNENHENENNNKNTKKNMRTSLLTTSVFGDLVDLTHELKILLSCISSLKGKTGISTICKILVKSKESSIIKKNYHNIKEYGKGEHKSTNWWSSFMKVARNDKFVKETLNYGSDMSYISIGLTSKGENFINGEEKYVISLPFFLSNVVKNSDNKKNNKNKNKKNKYNNNYEAEVNSTKRNDFSNSDSCNSKFQNYFMSNVEKENFKKIDSEVDENSLQTNLNNNNNNNKNPINKYDYFNTDKNSYLKDNGEKERKLSNEQINDSIMKILLRTRMLEARRQNIPPFQLISDQPLKDICYKRLTSVGLIRKYVDNISPICPNTFLEKIASGIRGFCLLHELETDININNFNQNNPSYSATIQKSSLKKFSNLITSFEYDKNQNNTIQDNEKNNNRNYGDEDNNHYLSRGKSSYVNFNKEQTYINNNNDMSNYKSNCINNNEKKNIRNNSINNNYNREIYNEYKENLECNNYRNSNPFNESYNIDKLHEYNNSDNHSNGSSYKNVCNRNHIDNNNNNHFSKFSVNNFNNHNVYNNDYNKYDKNYRSEDNIKDMNVNFKTKNVESSFKINNANESINKEFNSEKLTVLNKFCYKNSDNSDYNANNNNIMKNDLSAFFDDDFKFINEVQNLGLNEKNSLLKDKKGDIEKMCNIPYENKRKTHIIELGMNEKDKLNINDNNNTYFKKPHNFSSIDNNLNMSEKVFINSITTKNTIEEKKKDTINEKKKKLDLIDSFTYDNNKNYERDAIIHPTNLENLSFRDLKKRRF